MSSTPLVVTHPCALARDALDRILTKSQGRCVSYPNWTEARKTIWAQQASAFGFSGSESAT